MSFEPIDQAGAPREGRYRLTPSEVNKFLQLLVPSEREMRYRDAAWMILVVAILDIIVTSTGLLPSLSGCVVLATLPAEAHDAPLSYWSPGRVTPSEMFVAFTLLGLLATGVWLLGKSDRSLWLNGLTCREERNVWRWVLTISTGVYVFNVLLSILCFNNPLSHPLPLRIVMAIAATAFACHIVRRVREVTARHPKLHRSLVKAAVTGVTVLAGVALASQVIGVGADYPLALGEMKTLAVGGGVLAGGLMSAYCGFTLLNRKLDVDSSVASGSFREIIPAGAATPILIAHPASIRLQPRIESSHEVTVIASGEMFDQIHTPGSDRTPPVEGEIDGRSRDDLMVYEEFGDSARLVEPTRLKLSHANFRLIDRKVFRKRHESRHHLGAKGDWIEGEALVILTIDRELMPKVTSINALRMFAELFSDDHLSERIVDQFDRNLMSLYRLFELKDGTPLGSSPELLLRVVLERLNVGCLETLSFPRHQSLEALCIDAARLDFEAEAISTWINIVSRDAHEKLGVLLLGAREGVTRGRVLHSALGLISCSRELGELLGAVKLDVVFSAGENRIGFTPRTMDFFRGLTRPLARLRKEIKKARDTRIELARERRRQLREDQVAWRDLKIEIRKQVAAGVFDTVNASHVLNRIRQGVADSIISGLGFSIAHDGHEEPINEDTFQDGNTDYP